MAIATGLPPRELDAIADSSPELYDAFVKATGERWTTTDELLAGIYELTHANYRVLLSIAGAKKRDLPKPITVPRPGSESAKKKTKKTKTANPGEFAEWIRKRNEV